VARAPGQGAHAGDTVSVGRFVPRAHLARLLLLASVALTGACGRQQHAIGVILPLEGALKQFGHEMQSGIDLALSELPPERRPRMLVMDNGGSPQATSAAVDALVRQGATVIIGPLTTDNVAVATLAGRSLGVSCVAPAATGSRLVDPAIGTLRLCHGDEDVGVALARYARDTLRLERVAVAIDLASTYSVGLATAFSQEFMRRDGSIAGRVYFHGDTADADGVLDAVAGLDPDGAMLAAYAPDVVRMVNAAVDPRVSDLILLGGDGWNGAGVQQALEGRVRGAYRTRHFDPESHDPIVQDFVKRYSESAHEEPSDLAALGYDAARAVLSVFDPALEGPAIRLRLLGLAAHPGVTGLLTLDPRGAAVEKPVWLEPLHEQRESGGLGRIDR